MLADVVGSLRWRVKPVHLLGLVAAAGFIVPAVAEAKEVSICISGAVVAPAKVGGAKWDGYGVIAPAMIAAVAEAFAASNPYAVVLPVLAKLGQSTDNPDPAGTATILSDDVHDSTSVTLAKLSRDTYTPNWGGAGGGCPTLTADLDKHTRLRVWLEDRDASAHDPIDTVELSNEQLREALSSKEAHAVDVHEQGSGQILFVVVAVRVP